MKKSSIKYFIHLALLFTVVNNAFAKKNAYGEKTYKNRITIPCHDSQKHYNDHNNSVQFSAAKMFFPDHNKLSLIKKDFFTVMNMGQLGIYYERKIYNNWRIAVGVSEWNETGFLSIVDGIAGVGGYEDIYKTGSILTRWSYKMVDVFAMYRYNKFRKHKIKTGLGISYTHGANDYVDSVYVNPKFKYQMQHA